MGLDLTGVSAAVESWCTDTCRAYVEGPGDLTESGDIGPGAETVVYQGPCLLLPLAGRNDLDPATLEVMERSGARWHLVRPAGAVELPLGATVTITRQPLVGSPTEETYRTVDGSPADARGIMSVTFLKALR